MNGLSSFLLLLIAIMLIVILFPVGLLFTMIAAINTKSSQKAIGYLTNSALSIATAIDLLGNTACADLFNNTLRTAGGYPFGNYRETISRVLGKNKALGTLSKSGQFIADTLNKIQPNHVELAAKN